MLPRKYGGMLIGVAALLALALVCVSVGVAAERTVAEKVATGVVDGAVKASSAEAQAVLDRFLYEQLDAVYPSWRTDEPFVHSLRDLQNTALEKDADTPKNHRLFVKTKLRSTSSDERVTIRILRRTRGGCSGGSCG